VGGLPRRATFIKNETRDGVPAIVLESGGFAAPQILVGDDLAGATRKGEVVMRALAGMGYQALTIAEEDLYLGRENLEKALAAAGGKIAFLSANIRDEEGKPVFEPFTVIEAGGVGVGVLGLTSSEVDPGFLSQRYPGIVVGDPIEAARAEVPRLRERCDLVVALTHIGFGVDRELAARVPGIDLVIGGRTSTWLNPPMVVNGALIANGYFEGRAVGKLLLSAVPHRKEWVEGAKIDLLATRLAVARGGNSPAVPPDLIAGLESEVAAARAGDRFDGTLVDMTSAIPDDPDTAALIAGYREQMAKTAESAASRAVTRPEEAPVHFTGPAMCRDCHRARHLFWRATPHSRAFSTLGARNAAGDPDCLPCHTTGYLQPTGFAPATPRSYLRGVQCESCHGVGSLHGTLPESYRLVKTPPASMCLTCHTPDRDPRFDYGRMRSLVCGEAP
jgi:hypothetical protein